MVPPFKGMHVYPNPVRLATSLASAPLSIFSIFPITCTRAKKFLHFNPELHQYIKPERQLYILLFLHYLLVGQWLAICTPVRTSFREDDMMREDVDPDSIGGIRDLVLLGMHSDPTSVEKNILVLDRCCCSRSPIRAFNPFSSNNAGFGPNQPSSMFSVSYG